MVMKNYLQNNFNIKKLADVLDEVPFWSAPFGLKLLNYVDYRRNISALDIGFGTGFPLTELAMRLGVSSMVYGIDPWKIAQERTKKKIDLWGIPNIKIIDASAESIPLENGSIDLITSNNGINNISDIEKVISECSRIIKPGGQFIQTMNTDKTMFEFYDELRAVLNELEFFEEIQSMERHIYEKRRPVDEIISILKRYNFSVQNIEQDEFCYKFADGTAMLNHFFIKLAFLGAWIKILPSDKAEMIFDEVEKRMNKLAEANGYFKLTIPFVTINAIKIRNVESMSIN